MSSYTPSMTKGLKDTYGFRTSKSLGQNFLTDRSIIDKIIAGSDIGPGDLVIEIGPGLGVFTDAAAAKAKKVTAVEVDKNLMPILRANLALRNNVELINQDILKTDINGIIHKFRAEESREAAEAAKRGEEEPVSGNVRIIGNLPYYITTPIIMKILEDGVEADSITVMMQKEVGDRIRSLPGKKTYGAISVAVQYYCRVEVITYVSRNSFDPKPNVDSIVLKLLIRRERPVELIDEKVFFACVKAGFGQRRKTLLNSLTGVEGVTKEMAALILQESGIDCQRRAETLDLEEFAVLANETALRLSREKGKKENEQIKKAD